MERAHYSLVDTTDARSHIDDDAGRNARETRDRSASAEPPSGAAGWAPFPRPWRSDAAYGF